ncbi:MAG: glycosyltransferase [Candidatus Daviesbacteria bacterium]|nr:glycosyltransferase [Candidatus Daviesbacteria bacterium]
MKSQGLVSVIITTKNEDDVIANLLKSILKQTYKYIEIILVDNNSTDKTLEIASKFKQVKVYIQGPERSAQRNFGAKKAKGNYLFFLDADMELNVRVVEDCVDKIYQEKAECIVVPEESKWANFWGEVKAFERSFYSEKGDPVTDAARFFSKKIFSKVGGYDEMITGPEDWDLPDRIREEGFIIGRSTEIIYHHEQNISPTTLFKKKFYYGLNAHKYLSKHKIPVISPKTIYFLRPLFYKSWIKLVKHPILAVAMISMLFIELLGGGLGYVVGRIRG